ncbi:MAG: alpha-L-arabinofuranosidase C-terminal domain-containing protein [Armatimonadota bacterium]
MLALLLLALNKAAIVDMKVDATKTGVKVSPSLYGIFFEEINCAGDGGIYPELVRNRSFEDSDKLVDWKVVKGSARVSNGAAELAPGTVLTNPGFYGMNVVKNDRYQFTLRYSAPEDLMVTVMFEGTGQPQSKTVVLKAATEGTKTFDYEAVATDPKSSLWLATDKAVKLDFVSVFPKKTFKNRENGLRPDLMNLLTEMKPSFMRFPGGCWVEGDTMAFAMRWKTTINDLHLRKTLPNIWGYVSTNGLGYHEYLQMCEDLKADPLFVVNVGMSHKEVVPMDKMGEFVDDALDAIEYANGPVTSQWGAVRAKNGHPKPFNLKYLEIGNENGGPAYNERYKLFYDAVKAKYPSVITIANLWGGLPTSAPIEVIDEHYYNNPSFFFRNANRYDNYDRKGPKIYVGEYAVTSGCGNGNLIAALSEAAFMTGMERNSDVVTMSSYAPLFANVDKKAWNPDLIYFNSNQAAGTPSYFVQKMFARNRPDVTVETDVPKLPEVKSYFQPGGVGIGTWITKAEFKEMSVTENGKTTQLDPAAFKKERGDWTIKDGVATQNSMSERCRLVLPMPKSNTYTFRTKARKISGNEGFLLTVGHQDESRWVWLNLGGWRNTEHGVEWNGSGRITNNIPGKIEAGRWYDIEIDYSPERIVCRLDGEKIFDEKAPSSPVFFQTAGIDRQANELIIKVINGSGGSVSTNLNLQGAKPDGVAKIEILRHDDPMAENTLDNPRNVAPMQSKQRYSGGRLMYDAKPYSLGIVRVPLR